MKKIISSFFILCTLFISPLHADYDGMKQSLENYSPPGNFTPARNFKPRDKSRAAMINNDLERVISRIKTLKHTLEKSAPGVNIPLLPADMDQTILKNIAAIAQDREAVTGHIGQTMVMEEVEILAALRNPGVLAAKKNVMAELQSFNQVMALDENLRRYSAFTRGENNKVGPLKAKESMKFTYPSPGLTALKGRVIGSQAGLLVEKVEIARKKVVTDIQKAYWDLIFIEKSFRITSDTISAFNRLKDVATTLYKSGKTSFQDVIKINIKLEILKEELVTLTAQKRNRDIKILELLNLPVETRVGKVIYHSLPGKPAVPGILYPIAGKYRQELKAIRYKIAKLENMVEMSESMMESPFTLGFSTFENDIENTVGSDAEGKPFAVKTMAAMKNSSPVKPWYGVDAPWLGQTKATLSSLRETLVKEENATDRMVRDAWFNEDKTRRELELYKIRILPLSRSALAVSTREYEAGSIPFSQAIDSYTYWLKVKLTIAKKETDLGKFNAVLNNIIGKNL